MQSICISNGGYLASMETEEENKLLKEYVSALGELNITSIPINLLIVLLK